MAGECWVLLATASPRSNAVAQLRAGFGSAPLGIPGYPRTADGTPLVARCLILDDGSTRVGVLSLTLGELCPTEAQRIAEAAAEAAGVAPSHLLAAQTHVHSGPPIFTANPSERQSMAGHVAEAAVVAATQAGQTRPVRVGVATGHVTGISRVRRILRRDGSVITVRRAWPHTWGWRDDPETVGPEEPLDDRLTVMRVDDLDGRCLGTVMHFTCHPIPDFIGLAAQMTEQAMPGTVCLPLNGCLGDVDTPFEVPIEGCTQAEQLPHLAAKLHGGIAELVPRIRTRETGQVGAAWRPAFLPLDPDFLADPRGREHMWAQAIADGGFRTRTQCLLLGHLVLAGVPGEMYVGFGSEVERVSCFPVTRVVGLSDASVGYLLPERARARGGYEADPSLWGVVTSEGVDILLAAITQCLQELAAAAR